MAGAGGIEALTLNSPGAQEDMDEHTIEREYPYTYGLAGPAFLLVSIAFFAPIAAGTAYVAITGHQFLRGGPPPENPALLGGCALLLTAACVGSGVFLKKMLRGRNRRIAFTPEGILLPRDRFAAEEEFVSYRDITEWVFAEWVSCFKREVTFLEFYCSAGKFSIARQKLSRHQFDEVCTLLLTRVREIREHAAREVAAPAHRSLPLSASPAGGGCPGCGASLAPTAVICIECGFDRRTGRQLQTTRGRPDHTGGDDGYAVLPDTTRGGLFAQASAMVLDEAPEDALPRRVRWKGLQQLAKGLVIYVLWLAVMIAAAFAIDKLEPKGGGGGGRAPIIILRILQRVIIFLVVFPALWSAIKAFTGFIQCLTGVPFAKVNDWWNDLPAWAKLLSVPVLILVVVPFVLAWFVGGILVAIWAAGLDRR